MDNAVIDYKNLKFIIYQDGQPVDNPLPDEVQRMVIQQIMDDVCNEFRRQWLAQKFEDQPPGLKERIQN